MSLNYSILTAAFDCRNIRKICTEFETSYRMAQKYKILKQNEGVFGSPTQKKGKSLPDSPIETIKEFHEVDKIVG